MIDSDDIIVYTETQIRARDTLESSQLLLGLASKNSSRDEPHVEIQPLRACSDDCLNDWVPDTAQTRRTKIRKNLIFFVVREKMILGREEGQLLISLNGAQLGKIMEYWVRQQQLIANIEQLEQASDGQESQPDGSENILEGGMMLRKRKKNPKPANTKKPAKRAKKAKKKSKAEKEDEKLFDDGFCLKFNDREKYKFGRDRQLEVLPLFKRVSSTNLRYAEEKDEFGEIVFKADQVQEQRRKRKMSLPTITEDGFGSGGEGGDGVGGGDAPLAGNLFKKKGFGGQSAQRGGRMEIELEVVEPKEVDQRLPFMVYLRRYFERREASNGQNSAIKPIRPIGAFGSSLGGSRRKQPQKTTLQTPTHTKKRGSSKRATKAKSATKRINSIMLENSRLPEKNKLIQFYRIIQKIKKKSPSGGKTAQSPLPKNFTEFIENLHLLAVEYCTKILIKFPLSKLHEVRFDIQVNSKVYKIQPLLGELEALSRIILELTKHLDSDSRLDFYEFSQIFVKKIAKNLEKIADFHKKEEARARAILAEMGDEEPVEHSPPPKRIRTRSSSEKKVTKSASAKTKRRATKKKSKKAKEAEKAEKDRDLPLEPPTYLDLTSNILIQCKLADLCFSFLEVLFSTPRSERTLINILVCIVAQINVTDSLIVRGRQPLIAKRLNKYYNQVFNQTPKKWNLFVDSCTVHIKNTKKFSIENLMKNAEKFQKCTTIMLSIQTSLAKGYYMGIVRVLMEMIVKSGDFSLLSSLPLEEVQGGGAGGVGGDGSGVLRKSLVLEGERREDLDRQRANLQEFMTDLMRDDEKLPMFVFFARCMKHEYGDLRKLAESRKISSLEEFNQRYMTEDDQVNLDDYKYIVLEYKQYIEQKKRFYYVLTSEKDDELWEMVSACLKGHLTKRKADELSATEADRIQAYNFWLIFLNEFYTSHLMEGAQTHQHRDLFLSKLSGLKARLEEPGDSEPHLRFMELMANNFSKTGDNNGSSGGHCLSLSPSDPKDLIRLKVSIVHTMLIQLISKNTLLGKFCDETTPYYERGQLAAYPSREEIKYLMIANTFNNLEEGWRKGQQFTRLYRCSCGYLYWIGDCGRAMVIGKCPVCGAKIGGEQHKLVNTENGSKEITKNMFFEDYYSPLEKESERVYQVRSLDGKYISAKELAMREKAAGKAKGKKVVEDMTENKGHSDHSHSESEDEEEGKGEENGEGMQQEVAEDEENGDGEGEGEQHGEGEEKKKAEKKKLDEEKKKKNAIIEDSGPPDKFEVSVPQKYVPLRNMHKLSIFAISEFLGHCRYMLETLIGDQKTIENQSKFLNPLLTPKDPSDPIQGDSDNKADSQAPEDASKPPKTASTATPAKIEQYLFDVLENDYKLMKMDEFSEFNSEQYFRALNILLESAIGCNLDKNYKGQRNKIEQIIRSEYEDKKDLIAQYVVERLQLKRKLDKSMSNLTKLIKGWMDHLVSLIEFKNIKSDLKLISGLRMQTRATLEQYIDFLKVGLLRENEDPSLVRRMRFTKKVIELEPILRHLRLILGSHIELCQFVKQEYEYRLSYRIACEVSIADLVGGDVPGVGGSGEGADKSKIGAVDSKKGGEKVEGVDGGAVANAVEDESGRMEIEQEAAEEDRQGDSADGKRSGVMSRRDRNRTEKGATKKGQITKSGSFEGNAATSKQTEQQGAQKSSGNNQTSKAGPLTEKENFLAVYKNNATLKKLYQNLVEAWVQIMKYREDYGDIFDFRFLCHSQELPEEKINEIFSPEKAKLIYFIPSEKHPESLFMASALSTLVKIQNQFLKESKQEFYEVNFGGLETRSVLEIDPRSQIIALDSDFKEYLENFSLTDLRFNNDHKVIYDVESLAWNLQRQLLTQKIVLDCESEDQMNFKFGKEFDSIYKSLMALGQHLSSRGDAEPERRSRKQQNGLVLGENVRKWILEDLCDSLFWEFVKCFAKQLEHFAGQIKHRDPSSDGLGIQLPELFMFDEKVIFRLKGHQGEEREGEEAEGVRMDLNEVKGVDSGSKNDHKMELEGGDEGEQTKGMMVREEPGGEEKLTRRLVWAKNGVFDYKFTSIDTQKTRFGSSLSSEVLNNFNSILKAEDVKLADIPEIMHILITRAFRDIHTDLSPEHNIKNDQESQIAEVVAKWGRGHQKSFVKLLKFLVMTRLVGSTNNFIGGVSLRDAYEWSEALDPAKDDVFDERFLEEGQPGSKVELRHLYGLVKRLEEVTGEELGA